MDFQIPSDAEDASEPGEIPMFVIYWRLCFVYLSCKQLPLPHLQHHHHKYHYHHHQHRQHQQHYYHHLTIIVTTSRFSGAPYFRETQYGGQQHALIPQQTSAQFRPGVATLCGVPTPTAVETRLRPRPRPQCRLAAGLRHCGASRRAVRPRLRDIHGVNWHQA